MGKILENLWQCLYLLGRGGGEDSGSPLPVLAHIRLSGASQAAKHQELHTWVLHCPMAAQIHLLTVSNLRLGSD